MTAQSAAEPPAEQSEPKSDEPIDEPQPLSAYVRGTLTVHFDGGAVATRRAAQIDARAFLRKQKDAEESDEVTWSSRSWFTWANEHVVYSSFDADADQNWEITSRDRVRLTHAGHPHGVVASLVRFWERRGRRDEPMYSPRVVVSLHHLALDGVSGRDWEAVARLFEGTAGAERAARAWRATRPMADDNAPAEAAEEPSEEPEADQPDDVDGDSVQEDEGDGAASEDGPAAGGEPLA